MSMLRTEGWMWLNCLRAFPLVHQEARRELADDLAKAHINKADALLHLGDNQAGVGLYDRAIEI